MRVVLTHNRCLPIHADVAKNAAACCTCTLQARAASSVLATLEDRYARRLASWSSALNTRLCRLPPRLKPPKPILRHLSEAAVKQRISAYKQVLWQVLQQWESTHQQWKLANAKRKARARAVRDARKRVQKRVQ